jgi:glycosyltransferase involved in cell wall biosynthesis
VSTRWPVYFRPATTAAYDARVRVAFVYANPRRRLEAEVAAGTAPDTALLGQNHLAELGVDAHTVVPSLRRKERAAGLIHRLTWNARELLLPAQLRGFDVVCTPLATLLPLSARIAGAGSVIVFNISLCNTFDRSSQARRRLLRASLSASASVVCFAEAQQERLLAQTGLPRGQVATVALGVDADFYRPGAETRGEYVLAVGRDLARDYRTFLAAVERLGCRAIVVASERNLRGQSMPSNVEVRLDVSHAELRVLYAKARCVVIPTRREGYLFGADCSGQTTLLEAMAAGRPVVVSERRTLSDYIDHGDTALTARAEDSEALAQAIERIYSDGELARRLAVAGRRRVERQFTTRKLAERIVPVIRAAADASAAGATGGRSRRAGVTP